MTIKSALQGNWSNSGFTFIYYPELNILENRTIPFCIFRDQAAREACKFALHFTSVRSHIAKIDPTETAKFQFPCWNSSLKSYLATLIES